MELYIYIFLCNSIIVSNSIKKIYFNIYVCIYTYTISIKIKMR